MFLGRSLIFVYTNKFSYTKIHDFFSYTIKNAAPAVGTILNIVKRFGESYTLNNLSKHVCNTHIISKLAYIIIFYKQEWAHEMLKALFDLYEIKKEAIRNGKYKLAESIIQEFKNKICAIANK